MSDGLPSEADRLFGLPLEEFVTARNALARELRGDGRRDEAEQVAALRRPPPAVWAVNQLARHRSEDVERLLAAAERVRKGDARAADDVSAAVDSLVRTARGLLAGSGHAASDETLRRVAAALRTAPADEEHAEALRAGRLLEEPEPAGFAAMAAVAAAPRPAAKEKATGKAVERPDAKRIRAAREAVEEAEKRTRELEREASGAERAARRSREAADRAAADRDRKRQTLDRLLGRERR